MSLSVPAQSALISAETPFDFAGGGALHIVGNMGIYVQRRFLGNMSYDCTQRFYIHSACQRVGGEGMSEIVKAEMLALGSLQGSFEYRPYRGRMTG